MNARACRKCGGPVEVSRPNSANCRTCDRPKTPQQRAAAYTQKVRHVARNYGLTGAEYTIMLMDQNNACAICKRPFTATNRPQVDHHHETHTVRDLLCGPCNTGIARHREDASRLRAMADYLDRHKENQPTSWRTEHKPKR